MCYKFNGGNNQLRAVKNWYLISKKNKKAKTTFLLKFIINYNFNINKTGIIT